ncbi:MAG: 30S ribosomal protein S20 [Clostridia bacterium]|nr:30S ribosomal protein S20 [Clostridia bacterium]
MPNIKSAKKRVKVTASKTMQNKILRTALKTEMKKYEAAVLAGDKAAAEVAYKAAVKRIDKAVCRGIIHKNAAAHKKSQFTKKLASM